MNTEEGQDKIAYSLFLAFKEYKKQIDRKSNFGLGNDTTEKDDTPKPTISIEDINKKIIQQEQATNSDEQPQDNTTDENSTNDELLFPEPSHSDILYKVQILSSKTPLDKTSNEFKGLKNIEVTKDGNRYKYLIGNYSNYTEIIELKNDLVQYFPGAFIIAVKQGKIIPLQEALKENH
jgi:N-acetylmuramoyl-L-alanine amidase